MKICLITCYSQPDYIRVRTLRAALGEMKGVELLVVKNRHKGVLRYIEVTWKVLVARLIQRPDVYFLTFRGYEMLPVVRFLSIGKSMIFDEFINLAEYVVYEHRWVKKDSVAAVLLWWFYRFWLNTTTLITTDTPSHAAYSAALMKLPLDRYVPLIVSSDDTVFYAEESKPRPKGEPLKVFFYGLLMTPLQGLSVILEATELLKDRHVEFQIIGGKDSTAAEVAAAQKNGANITYKKRVPFEELAVYMRQVDVCLGGPFGKTTQSDMVIGGKTFQFLQSGKPTIIGRNQESYQFRDKKDCLIVEPNDPKALAGAIAWADDNRKELLHIGEAARMTYEKKFSKKVLKRELRVLLGHERLT